jgi:hypothetical protein
VCSLVNSHSNENKVGLRSTTGTKTSHHIHSRKAKRTARNSKGQAFHELCFLVGHVRGQSCTRAAHMRLLNSIANAHAKGVISVAACGSIIASGGYDGNLRLWTLEKQSLRLLHEVDVDVAADSAGPIFSVALETVEDGHLMLAAGSYCRRLRVWHCDSISASPQLRWHSTQHTGWVRALAVDSRQGSPPALYSIGCNFVLGWSLPKVSPSGAPCTRDGQIAIYEDEQHVFSHDVLCLAHGNAEEALAAGSVDGALRIWSTRELHGGPAELPERRATHWKGHEGRVAAVTWLDGQLLSAGYDGWVRAWRRPEPRHGTMASPERRPDMNPDEMSPEIPWDLDGALRVVTTEGGRALSLTSAAGGLAICTTSDGEVLLLRGGVQGPTTAPQGGPAGALGSRIECVDRLRLGAKEGETTRRATSAASVSGEGHGKGADDGKLLIVVGDSEGALHVVSAA